MSGRHTCLGLSLRARQVDQVQLAAPDGVRVPRGIHHLESDGEDGVRARGVRVHEGGASGPVLPTSVHELLTLHRVVDRVLGQPWNIISAELCSSYVNLRGYFDFFFFFGYENLLKIPTLSEKSVCLNSCITQNPNLVHLHDFT